MPNYHNRVVLVMKRQTTIAMFGILFVAAMALGTITVSGFSQPLFVASTDTKAASNMGMLGHITLTATDPDGKIISYIQTDNVIVSVGENCVAESIFDVATSAGTHECTGVGVHDSGNGLKDGGFTSIAIGTVGALNSETEADVALLGEIFRIQDTIPDVIDSDGTVGSTVEVTLISQFIATAEGTTIIVESGIFDDPTDNTGNMLARKTFNPISLAKDDKLTVEWEITIGS